MTLRADVGLLNGVLTMCYIYLQQVSLQWIIHTLENIWTKTAGQKPSH